MLNPATRCCQFCLLVVLLAVGHYAAAQTPAYQFSHLDIRQGLSHNQVNTIFKDQKGFLWFGTVSGLNRYDGYDFRVFKHDARDTTSIGDNNVNHIFEGPGRKLWINTRDAYSIYDPVRETFNRNYRQALRQLGVPDSGISAIVKDHAGAYWFVHPTKGLYRYDSATQHATRFAPDVPAGARPAAGIVAFAESPVSHDFWLIRGNGLVQRLDGRTFQVAETVTYLQDVNTDLPQLYSCFIDAQGDCWMYTPADARGVFYYNPSTKNFLHLTKDNGPTRLNNNIVNNVTQDDNGLIWIGTDHGGVNLLDKKDFSIRYIVHNDFDDNSISQNSVISIYKDNTGTIWMGTYKQGVNYYQQHTIKFPLFRHHVFDAASLPFDDVNRFVEDARGNLWIGTNGGGLLYFNRASNTFTQYRHQAGNGNSISNDVIVSLCIDHEQKLWIGTFFGGLDCYDGRTFTHYRHNNDDTTSLSDDRVWEVYEDHDQKLWIGTLAAGVDEFDRAAKVFHHYRSGQPNSMPDNYISDITEDAAHNLWFGTSQGVAVLNKQTGQVKHYNHTDGLSYDNVIAIKPDSRGLIWIGTHEGLNCFDPATGTFRVYMKEDGLPDNTVLTILEDNNHNLWLGTPNGLSNVLVSTEKGKAPGVHFINYDETAGLQSREFNENAAYKTRRGEMIFGGPGGFNIFNPERLAAGPQTPVIVFTDFQVFNKSIAAGEPFHGRVLLPVGLPETKEITLRYNEDVFSVSFAALDFGNNGKTEFAYLLEGFSKDWLMTDGRQRKATFTNLDPGTYVLRVKVAQPNGQWSRQEATLTIRIKPPFWRTPLAFVIYAVLAVAILLLGRRQTLARARLKFNIEQERKEAQQLHELDMMKIRFFTNVSHEFRTPLSLILAPVEKLLKQASDPDQQKQFGLIYRNARRLLNLVNQLLDFRKMEVQEFKLNLAQADIIAFIRDLSYSFSDISEKKNIHFSFQTDIESFTTAFDKDKLEKIGFNLLSNAFKFTPENGSVSVAVHILPAPAGEPAGDVLQDGPAIEIRVRDTGIGIPADQQERIFERFFQHDLPGNMLNQGSGIGLAITKEFVKLHNGTIVVESEPEKGSCFTVRLPIISSEVPVAKEETDAIHEVIDAPTPEEESGARKGKKPVLLIVEDNEDFRFYLKDNLRSWYHIEEAPNGREGWVKAQAMQPDLIVSDIMMPEMNGLELSRHVKNDPRTSHIPVILLTARAAEEQQLEGFDTGANDYITKPFNFEILRARIRNLLAQRKAMHKLFQKQVEINPSAIAITSMDEQFLQQALQVVEKNIADPEFSVESFSKELFMSRVALYKKLTSLTGKSPIDFIRHIRLKRAAQLLQKSQRSVSEIAYEVGFNNPKYFAKYFKKEFGVQPSAYKDAAKNNAAPPPADPDN